MVEQRMVKNDNPHAEVFHALVAKGSVREFSKGSIIFYQGEVPRGAAILLDGSIKAYNLSPSGEEQLVTFHVPFEFFPSAWLFGHASGATYFYEAFSDCSIGIVSRSVVQEFINSSSRNLKLVFDQYVKNYTGNLMRITALEQTKAAAKITYTLFFLCQRYGKKQKNGWTRISLKLTHQHFASLVGLTRETTATEMKKLEKAGIVTYEQQTYEVNIEKLLRHMGDESFNDIKLR